MEDTPTENKNVYEFSKRYEDKFGAKPPPTPKWDITYDQNGNLVQEIVEGYIFSLMPTLMFAATKEAINSANETTFAIPYETLKRLERVKEDVSL